MSKIAQIKGKARNKSATKFLFLFEVYEVNYESGYKRAT